MRSGADIRSRLARLTLSARAAIHAALFLGVLTRALLPPGFMPTINPDRNGIIVAMCSGSGAVQALPAHTPKAPQPPSSLHDICPFAFVPTFAILPGTETIPEPFLTEWAFEQPPPTWPFVANRQQRPYAPPTGPPPLA